MEDLYHRILIKDIFDIKISLSLRKLYINRKEKKEYKHNKEIIKSNNKKNQLKKQSNFVKIYNYNLTCPNWMKERGEKKVEHLFGVRRKIRKGMINGDNHGYG